MSTGRTTRRAIGIAAWLVAFHVLLAYGLPEWLFITLVLALGITYWRLGAPAAVLVSLTLLVVTGFYALALKITGLEDRIYYRPDEKFLSFDYTYYHRAYKRNVRYEMQMPHGDLRALTAENITEPRHVVFQTDSEGFRNERDYHGQRYVLVGDSFVAGNSNSQPDVLYAQLLSDYGLDTYSLAYQGNLADYASYIRGFRQRHGENFRVLLFLFEGNDFDESRSRPENVLARYGRRYYSMFSEFNTYRVTMSLYKRYLRGRATRNGNEGEVTEVGGKKVAFYRHYMDVTRRARLDDVEGFDATLASIRPDIERIYFIPTKYRVYAGHLKGGEALPNAQWDYLNGLCQKYVLHCTNLTAPLTREADALLKKGEYVWWRDDTHWNRAGIAVAARIVAGDLGAGKDKPR